MMKKDNHVSLDVVSDTEVDITRSFDAPRERVFDAFTKPELAREWLWARESPLVVCEIEPEVGGRLRYVWRMPDGKDMGLSGKFLEIERPQRTVHTEIFDEDWTGGETVVTTHFEAVGSRTRVTMRIRYASMEGRDAAMRTDMVGGMGECYAKLDSLLSGTT
jgi:uncharacterized protein YndB with AHSA1/START domain